MISEYIFLELSERILNKKNIRIKVLNLIDYLLILNLLKAKI